MSSEDNTKIYEKYWGNLKQLIQLGIFFAKDINGQYGYNKIEVEDLELANSLLHEISPQRALPNFEKFITTSYPHWGKLLERDRVYFTDNSDAILSAYTKMGSDCFKNLFTVKSVDNPNQFAIDGEDADEVWEYFIEFVKMAIRHIHVTRSPTIHRDKSSINVKYANPSYMDSIDIVEWSKIYNVNLTWV